MRPTPVDPPSPPRRDWPAVLLKFLVFAAYAFVLATILLGLGGGDLTSQQAWVVVAGLFGLLLLLAVDRLQALSIRPTGVEARLSEAKAQALETVTEIEDPQVRQEALEQIARAQNVQEVQSAAEQAVELNIDRNQRLIREAIQDRRVVRVTYKASPDQAAESLLCAPLDISPGRTEKTHGFDYFWAYSLERERPLSFRLDRVLGVDLTEETFIPAQVTRDFKRQDWNIPRAWQA